MLHLPLGAARSALIALALLASATTVHAAALPAGMEGGCAYAGCEVRYWAEASGGNGHYYAFVPTPADQAWTAANTSARSSSIGAGSVGHLVSISSAAESAYVIANVLPTGFTHKRQVWLGGFQNDTTPKSLAPTEGWQHANPLNVEPEHWNYTNWAPGEANDENDQHTGDERFLAMWVHYYQNAVNYRGRWNDESDVADGAAPIVGMLLEWEGAVPVPEPASLLLVAVAVAGLALRRRAAR